MLLPTSMQKCWYAQNTPFKKTQDEYATVFFMQHSIERIIFKAVQKRDNLISSDWILYRISLNVLTIKFIGVLKVKDNLFTFYKIITYRVISDNKMVDGLFIS